jgi:hypothetical protein
MPYCTKCRAEYLEGVEICPDCQLTLVAELPPKDEIEYVALVELEKVPDEISGIMMKGILLNSGIDVVLQSDKISWLDGISDTWSKDYWGQLLVPKEEFEKARKILDEYLGSIEDLDTTGNENLNQS